MGYPNRVTSSVIFVSRLDVSIGFYSDVFFCHATIHDPEAALLVAPTVPRST